MSEHRVTIDFAGSPRSAVVSPGRTLLEAAREVGVDIVATCGGRGRCRSCRVKLIKGSVPPPSLADLLQLGDEEVHEGYRLSCQYAVTDDATVQISPPLEESAFQILEETASAGDGTRLELDSGVAKVHAQVTPPRDRTLQTSDLDELLRAIETVATDAIGVDILRRVPTVLRESPDGVTLTSFGASVLAIEPGNATEQIHGVAFDIGTTTVVGYLIDLATGETLATVSGLNPQTVYGGDLMSRISFAAQERGNVRKLRSRIVGFLNELLDQACAEAEVSRERVYKVVVVGNTCMHHLFLGIDPTFVGQAPYAPAIRDGYACLAREVGLRAHANARLFLLPLVAGFVGADTVGMILSTGIHASAQLRVAVDIGTNAEVVMGSRDRLMACSSPAGPALEGGQIRCGMRAAAGAIDWVRIDDALDVHTIGEAPPIGLCGSGLIDAVAALLDAGILEPSGRLLPSPDAALPESVRSRIREDADGIPEFVLSWARDSGHDQDIVLTQTDIRQLQLAKAAIGSGVQVLEREMGVTHEGITELLLSGGFGNYLSIRSARRIGLIPDLPASRVRYVANAAGLGAQMALLSERARRRADELAAEVAHLSLADHPQFQRLFIDAIRFPEAIEEHAEDEAGSARSDGAASGRNAPAPHP
jgi:uncharacterized 2Fe-2S/4Fe-4S cluster protein (DUF4445 family)